MSKRIYDADQRREVLLNFIKQRGPLARRQLFYLMRDCTPSYGQEHFSRDLKRLVDEKRVTRFLYGWRDDWYQVYDKEVVTTMPQRPNHYVFYQCNKCSTRFAMAYFLETDKYKVVCPLATCNEKEYVVKDSPYLKVVNKTAKDVEE